MKIGIIPTMVSNTTSLISALESLKADVILLQDKKDILKCQRIILPGVGHMKYFMEAMKYWKEPLEKTSLPLLGICLGMQGMFEYSEEHEEVCLGWIPGKVEKIKGARCPHMGWGQLQIQKEYVYFIHSYGIKISSNTIDYVNHHESWSAVVQKERFCGMQFHPERSGEVGLRFLDRFLKKGDLCN